MKLPMVDRITFLRIFIALGLVATAAQARGAEHGAKLTWRRIVGIMEPSGIVGRHPGAPCDAGVSCVEGTPAAWTATDGRAELDLDRGTIEFSVRGLVLAADPTFSNIGTTSVVTMVKGTLVCNDTEPGLPELVDTDAVPLDRRGNARFRGAVDLPASCVNEPEDIVFLIRIADVADPDRAFLIDLWNAFGAIRTSPNTGGGAE